MLLENFRPRSNLVTRQTTIERAKYPVIDAHNHLAEPFGNGWDRRPLSELIDQLDASGIIHFVDLDGGWGEDLLHAHLDRFKSADPERFSIFGGVNWQKWLEMGHRFPDWAVSRLQGQWKDGAEGLKIWKNLGLQVRDQRGDLVRVNDPRLDQLWQAAGELGLPVMIHVADPVSFFDPIDETNERWEELQTHPDWAFTSPPYPPFMQILNDFAQLVERHPRTTFIGAHVGCYAENLTWVGALLDHCSNLYVDIAARISELGRQPYTARRFFLRYADRILFGSDFGPESEIYHIIYRFLETQDEYFNYNPGDVPLQGRWNIYGIDLPDDVLAKVYHQNALRILKISRKI